MNPILEQIYRIGIVPVVAIDDAAKAVPLARALVAGGLPVAEITFRTAAAEEAMRAVSREVPGLLLGAGTVLTRAQADRALDAGARFIVSPGFNPGTVGYVRSKGAVMLPGTATPGEMEQAMALGLEAVKFFPAEQNGGVEKLRALAGPYRSLMWMPTGGVSAENLADYLSLRQTLACGGTWMVKKELIEGERWAEITALCRQAVQTMLGFSLHHVGIPCGDADTAAVTARAMGEALGLPYRQGGSSDFALPFVECCKKPLPGPRGHIAVGCSSVERAEYHLGLRGVRFLEQTRKTGPDGRTTAIYLDADFCGFAVHLIEK